MTTKTGNYFVTLRTNDQCEFDPFWADEELAKLEEKPYDLSFLKSLEIKQLNICGGEPLLRDDLAAILAQAKELGMTTRLLTNGLLYPEQASKLSGLVDHLFISLDYPNAEMHDRSRGVECFTEVVQAIKQAKASGQNPIIKFTVTRDSVMYTPEMVELAESLGVQVYLSPVSDFFGTQGFESATIDHLKYYWRNKRVLINLAALEFTKYHGNRTHLPRCKAQDATITILPDGRRVAPCFYNQNGAQGREDVCSGCLAWEYMIPSFSKGLDKYFWLNLISEGLRRHKMASEVNKEGGTR